MFKTVVVLLIISALGNVFGLYIFYKYHKAKGKIAINQREMTIMAETIDGFYSHRIVFLHHSVGSSILQYGGLFDSLSQRGIAVKSATYGDRIGDRTDMCDWLPKFQRDMDDILKFKSHPDLYYNDGTTNEAVMFKSCFPNSDVVGAGELPGDPLSKTRTVANYKAVFVGLVQEFKKRPDKLFIFLTTPPLVPSQTTEENAARAREFNQWLVNELQPGYEKETGLDNFHVFDLFAILTDASNYLKSEYRQPNPNDAHPNELAAKAAASDFMEFFIPIWENWLAKSEAGEVSAPS